MKKQTKTDKPTRAVNRAKLWGYLTNDVWLRLAREHKPNHAFTAVNASRIKGKCIFPGHQDTDPSFTINTQDYFAYCFGCNQHLSDPVALVSLMLGADKAQAISYLRDKLSITALNRKAEEELEKQQANQAVKQEIYYVTHECMCNAIAQPEDENHAYAQDAINWLTRTRGLNIDDLHTLPIGVMPNVTQLATQARKRHTQAVNIYLRDLSSSKPIDVSAAIQEYLSPYITIPGFVGSVVFPLHQNLNEIARFKLRMLSASKDRDFIITENADNDLVGLFGLGWLPYRPLLLGKDKQDGIYVTEGEMDALALMSHFTHETPPYVLVSAGGTGAAADIEPILRNSNTSKVFLVPDSPTKQGDIVATAWCSEIRQLKIKIFDAWDQLPGLRDAEGNDLGQDLDSAVARYGAITVADLLAKTTNPIFHSPGPWFFTRTTTAIDALVSDDLRTRVEAAVSLGKNIKNKLDREEFIKLVARHYDLNPAVLARELTARDENQIGFILQIADAILRLFYVVGHKSVGTKRHLVLYNKETKVTHEIVLGSTESIMQEIAPITGTIIVFIDKYVGFPAFIDNPYTTDAKVVASLTTELLMYMRDAMLLLCEGAPDMYGTRLRQGYHVLKDRETRVEYIVQGPDVIKILRTSEDELNPVFQYLEGPSDPEHNVVFDLRDKDDVPEPYWYPNGFTADDFQRVQGMSIRDLYYELINVFNTGFNFVNHDVTIKLLAALTLTLPIQDIFNRPAYMFITGDSKAGKSTLLSLLVGTKHDLLRLLYCSHRADNYTIAGVAKDADRCNLCMVLDEFEVGDYDRAKSINGILEMFRGLVNGMATRSLGRHNGGGTNNQIFKQATIYSAIQVPTKTQDANRMLLIELKKPVERRQPIETQLPLKFTAAQWTSIRERLNIGMYQYATALASMQKEIEEELFTLQSDSVYYLDPRLASAFIAPLTIMKYIGEDWQSFIKDYIDANASNLQQLNQTSESEALLSAILRYPIVRFDNNQLRSLMYMLTQSELRADLSSSEYGCYYDNDQQLLLLLVDVAIARLLPPEMKKYGRTVHQLKAALDRHPLALKYEEIETSNILPKTCATLGPSIRAKDVCVFRAKPWLDEITKSKNFVREKLPNAIKKIDTAASPSQLTGTDLPQIPISMEETNVF